MVLQRRRLLSAVATSTALVAGCIGVPDGSPEHTPTPRPAAAVGCPTYDRQDVERVVCSTDPPDDTLVFEPDTISAELPRAEIVCRLENDRTEAFASNFYNTTLHTYDSGEWWYLGPYVVPQPLHTLPAGETHRRRFVVDNTDLRRVRPPVPEAADEQYVSGRHGLGPGTYVLAIESSSEGPATRYAAAFTLRGDPISLVAPETVTGTERDGARRIVRVEPTLDGDTDRLTLRVSRRPDPPREAHPLIDEQLYHFRYAGLRAAFALFDESVATVEVRGDDSQYTRNLTHGSGPNFLEYDGGTYEIQVDPYDA